ncbi:MAG: nucleotidyltransferase family protein [Pseudomonadota bacterium]
MRAMVLAAGFGKRLRPITLETPKPLVEVAGRSLLERTLDQLAFSGVKQAVVNVHYLGEQIMAFASASTHRVSITISDERDAVLETAGGIIKALPLLGDEPFISLNADTFWVEQTGTAPIVEKMAAAFNPDKMDMLLLICAPEQTVGHSGGLDFVLSEDGQIARAGTADEAYVYAGVAIISPRIFDGADAQPHSLNRYFDKAIADNRLFGMTLEKAYWYTVSTPESLKAVEAHLRAHGDMAPLPDHDS